MRSKTALVEKIQNATRDVPTIGSVVFWQQLGQIGGYLYEIQAKAGVYGLDKAVPPAPSHGKVLERSVKAWLRAGATTGVIPGFSQDDLASLSDDPDQKPKKRTKKSIQINKIETANDQEWVGVILTVKEVDLAAYGVNYQTPLRVFLNLKDGRVSVSSAPSGLEFKGESASQVSHPQIAYEIKEQVTKYTNLLMGDEIRALILNALDKMRAVSLREAGGVYFVDVTQTEALKNLDSFVQSLEGLDGAPNTAVFVAQGIINEKEAQKKYADMLYNGLMAEIDKLNTELENFKADKKSRKIKSETTTKKMVMCLDLIRKVKELGEILGQRTQTLTSEVERLGKEAGVLIEYSTHFDPNGLADQKGEAREGEADVKISYMEVTQTAQTSQLQAQPQAQTPQEDFLSFLAKRKGQQ